MLLGSEPRLDEYQADNCEKCKYDLTAWNNPWLLIKCSSLCNGFWFWMDTVHCSNKMDPGSGMVENSTDRTFCWLTRQLEHSKTSMLTGTLFCHKSNICLRKFSSFLHRLFSSEHSCRAALLRGLVTGGGTWGPSPYPRPSVRGIRPSTIRLARPQKTSVGSMVGLPTSKPPTRLVGCIFTFNYKICFWDM